MVVHVQIHACHCIIVTFPMFCRSELQRRGDAHVVSCFSVLYFRIEAMTVNPSLPPVPRLCLPLSLPWSRPALVPVCAHGLRLFYEIFINK